MRIAEFAKQYESLTDDELIHLVAERDTLVHEAQLALDAELRRRNLTPDAVQQQRQEVETADAEAERKAAGETWLIHPWALGKTFYGKWNRSITSGGSDEYDATLWAVLLWFPLIPLGTYRLHRPAKLGKGVLGWFVDRPIQVLERKQRNWNQILFTWICAVTLLLVIRFLPQILFWLLNALRRG